MQEAHQQELAHKRHMRKLMRAIYILAAIGVVLAVYLWVISIPPPNGKYDAFASCIASSGTKFYGAFWCPHCQAQKAEFGDSARLLPYIECSTPDANGQTQVCISKGIQEYPTWYFPDGSSSTGALSLETLSQKTNCPLPTSTR
jgi:thiol-disulfide isomerase/thioredoxin